MLTINQLTALFLQTSLADCLDDYTRQLKANSGIPHWDAVIITASNASQAEGYQRQLDYRRQNGWLPANTDFIIVPDKGNRRVGSAGSTLSVIRELKARYGSLEGRRFLTIHAGGDSKRTPQYSALGKLFSPIPTEYNGRPAALFDMFMVSMASIPGRLRDGMLLLSGDVILLFNPLMCDFGNTASAIITFKEDVETGKNHGVCVPDSATGKVRCFLHKQSVERLRAEGAIDERNNVNIDTGAVYLGTEILDKLYALVENDADYEALVNDKTRLSLYGDIVYALSENATLEQLQKETPEGEYCEELTEGRRRLWNAIGSYSMKCMSISPSRFIHFGSTPGLLSLMEHGVQEYESLGWKRQINSSIDRADVAGYNSVLSSGAGIGSGCYLEVSYIHGTAQIGSNCLISYTDLHDEHIPDNLLVHSLKQNNGKFVCRIMGVKDNPKQDLLFGRRLEDMLAERGIATTEIWSDGENHSLWNARLYPECDTIREAVQASLEMRDILTGAKASSGWLNARRKSLCSGFNDADSQAIIDWNARMEEIVRMDKLKKLIQTAAPARNVREILGTKQLSKIQQKWLETELAELDTSRLPDFSYAMRLYYYLGVALGDDSYTKSCFKLIAKTVQQAALKHLSYNASAHITGDVTVQLPLRVNWGGGWSDTCPHCLENGGAVLNAAITLDGKFPVEVRLARIPEKKIVFISNDMGTYGEFTDIQELQRTGDPFDNFALQKACLLACGIIPQKGGNLGEILDKLGGGFEMHSEVTNVPKGSGLGTSSILSAAAVKAMLQFCGIPFTSDTLYSTVLAMEQIMSTGGGWQDQVGGVTPGIKFITSEPGIEQQICVKQVKISEATRRELSERFAVIYTGQRRLARNLLRDVVGRYVGNEPDSISAHKEIQRTAALMRFALERGNVDEFAKLLDSHWKLSQMIDAGSTNTLIDQIFMSIEDMIDARMCCGAGGGGFIQVILKRGVTKDDVHQRLKDVFQDFTVDVWPSEIVY